jgi:hypothetical protein
MLLTSRSTVLASLTVGGVLLFVILARYIYTRRQLLVFRVGYGKNTTVSQRTGTHTPLETPRRSIYDRWLMLRFSVAFVMLGIFQLSTIVFQAVAKASNTSEALKDGPDLSSAAAKADFLRFMPGVTPSCLVFIVFGTTRQFMETIKRNFAPRWFLKGSSPAPAAAGPQSMPNSHHRSRPTSQPLGYPQEDNLYSPTYDSTTNIPMSDIMTNESKDKQDDEMPILTTTVQIKGHTV